jgi:hypothetical protein
MITDMDMLPTKPDYFIKNIEQYKKEDFISYRDIPWHEQQVYMCYNAAHPETWSTIFNIKTKEDIIKRLNTTYLHNVGYKPADAGWYIDQRTLFDNVLVYPHWIQLNREYKRLEATEFKDLLASKKIFINDYDDVHFFRDYGNFAVYKEAADEILRQIQTVYSFRLPKL